MEALEKTRSPAIGRVARGMSRHRALDSGISTQRRSMKRTAREKTKREERDRQRERERERARSFVQAYMQICSCLQTRSPRSLLLSRPRGNELQGMPPGILPGLLQDFAPTNPTMHPGDPAKHLGQDGSSRIPHATTSLLDDQLT